MFTFNLENIHSQYIIFIFSKIFAPDHLSMNNIFIGMFEQLKAFSWNLEKGALSANADLKHEMGDVGFFNI